MNSHDPLETFTEITRQQAAATETPNSLRAHLAELQAAVASRQRRRRRRTLALIAGMLTVGAGVSVAAVIIGGQPTRPEGGPACHAGPLEGSAVVVLSPGADPLDGCGNLWAQGQLPNPENPSRPPQPVPPLAVCVGEGGTLEVYPGPPDLCATLGMVPGDTALDQSSDAVAELTNRIAEDINLADCAGVAQVEQRVRQTLDRLELTNWTITRSPGADAAKCVKAEIDSTSKDVSLHPF